VNGDSIFNGADDNASGTVALLAIARALRRAPPPPRSVLFVWHTAEKHGPAGANWFVAHPKHDDWHRVTDEASRIDYERLRRVSTLVANVASELARHRQSVTKGGGMHRRSCGR
jgi:Zn-dependent M28 family amino/carboxypeptidase